MGKRRGGERRGEQRREDEGGGERREEKGRGGEGRGEERIRNMSCLILKSTVCFLNNSVFRSQYLLETVCYI